MTEIQNLKISLAEVRTSVDYLNKFMWAVLGVTVLNTLESCFKLVSNHITHLIVGGLNMYGSLPEFLAWLAGGGAVLGVIASFIVQVIKKIKPGFEDAKAKYLSIIIAVIISFGAKALLPYVNQLPSDVLALWAYVVYLFEQIVFDWLHNSGVDSMGFWIWKRSQK